MRYIFKFPDIGEGLTEGKILKWHVNKGQTIKSGEPVVEMETDKVVTDIPSPQDGVVVGRFGQEGEVINVGDPLLELEIPGVEGEEARRIAAEKPRGKSEAPVEEPGFGVVGTLEVAGEASFMPSSNEGLPEPPEKKPRDAAPGRKVLATPVARAMAREMGIDIQSVRGTGPGGRVTKKDLENHAAAAAVPTTATPPVAETAGPEYAEIELTQIRKAIARRMVESKQNAPHMTVFEEVEISALDRLRREQKEAFAAEGLSLTYLPFILKATATALKNHPDLNSTLDLPNNRLIHKFTYNLGIAVDAPDGLMVPVIRNADRLSIRELAQRISHLADKARERKLTHADLQGGTFSITNYGVIAGIYGAPILNYPETAILGIGRIHQKPVVKDGEIVVGTVLPLSLAVDHRVVDGGEASRFLREVMNYLTDPVSLLLR